MWCIARCYQWGVLVLTLRNQRLSDAKLSERIEIVDLKLEEHHTEPLLKNTGGSSCLGVMDVG
jgi:hypothetical protein